MVSDGRHDLKDDDSIVIDDKLEDESYPISDKVDSDFYDMKTKDAAQSRYPYTAEDSFEFDSIRDREDCVVDISATKKDDFSIYRTTEREDILDLVDTELEEVAKELSQRKTSFYIGESSVDVITKSPADPRDDEDSDGEPIEINPLNESAIEVPSEVILHDALEFNRLQSAVEVETTELHEIVSELDLDHHDRVPLECMATEVETSHHSELSKGTSFQEYIDEVPSAQMIDEHRKSVSFEKENVEQEANWVESKTDELNKKQIEENKDILLLNQEDTNNSNLITESEPVESLVERHEQFEVSDCQKISDSKTKLELNLNKLETDQFSEYVYELDEIVDQLADDRLFPDIHKATVVHSPPQIFETIQDLDPVSIVHHDVRPAESLAEDQQRNVQSELDKINESFAECDIKQKQIVDQSVVEQSFAEVEESLRAVHEDLIEVVKDGRQIKESPSEFEFKILPNIKYPVLEPHDEEDTAHLQMLPDPLRDPSTETIVTVIETTVNSESSPSVSQKSHSPQIPTAPVKSEDEYSSAEGSVKTLEVIHRKTTSHKNRWSATDIDHGSSSNSQYDSFEKSDSRPTSSDVDNLFTSSEYQTAQDASFLPGSTEYQTAINTMDSSSRGSSLRSFDSQSSGNLGSVEYSEASETLVPSTLDLDLPSDSPDLELDETDEIHFASLDSYGGVLLEQFDETVEPQSISPSMKRSQEMHFDSFQETPSVTAEPTLPSSTSVQQSYDDDYQPEEHAVEINQFSRTNNQQPYSLDESRFATSLEDGSILSQSMSSASNIETIVENMASSFGSSMVGSYEAPHSLPRDDFMSGTSFEEPTFMRGEVENMTMTTSVVKGTAEVSNVNTQITTTMVSTESTQETPVKRTKGHKRTDSTSFLKSLEASKLPVVDVTLDEEKVASDEEDLHDDNDDRKGSAGGSGSDSDYDRYETEYSRSFRQPVKHTKKRSSLVETVDRVEIDKIERKVSLPCIETIVEDVIAEVELESGLERAVSQNMLDYSNIPDIMITDDPTKYIQDDDIDSDAAVEIDIPDTIKETTATQDIADLTQFEPASKIKISEKEFQEMIDNQYRVKEAAVTTTYDVDSNKADSPTSDSFEILDQPDIADDFVIIEEVAKEAGEFDTEGKGVSIQSMKHVKKHDEEVEALLVRSAPAATNEGSIIYQGHTELGFDFEESPPTGHESAGVSTQYDPNGLDSSRKWVEMQLAEQAQNLRYPYDIERGVLEDIKEEDTDMEVGSSRISSFKDSFSSSTPDYDVLAGRRYFAKEHDDMSVNSLQEFESLEQAISLENRRLQHGSQDSLSNGSFHKRYVAKAGGQGDDISLASLKEFEGLENACIEAHLIEIKAKEEAALLLSRSDESNSSPGKGSPRMTTVVTTVKTTVDSSAPVQMVQEKRTVTSTTVTTSTRTGFEPVTTNQDDNEDRLTEISSDSIDTRAKASHSKDASHYGSTDSLEINRSTQDIMTSSIDSIEAAAREDHGTTKSSRSDADSLDQLQLFGTGEQDRRDSIDSIEMQFAHMSQATAPSQSYDRDSIDGNTRIDVQTSVTHSGSETVQTRITTTTTSSGGATYSSEGYMSKDISSDSLNVNQSEPDLLLTSTESLDRSSATNATYHNASDSQMSGSLTSCGSNTLIDQLDSQYTDLYAYQGSSFDQPALQGTESRSSSTSTSATGGSSTTVTTIRRVVQTTAGGSTTETTNVEYLERSSGRVLFHTSFRLVEFRLKFCE